MKRVVYLYGQKEDRLVEHIEFPTGEKHIRIKGLQHDDDVVLVYNDPSGDIMKLGMAVNICRQAEVSHITVVMPFVPYARQDEVYVEGDPLSIKVFAEFLNSLDVDQVVIADPHSKVTPALINNAHIVHQHEVAMAAVLDLDQHLVQPIALVGPDLGSAKKIEALQAYIKKVHNLDFPIIQCDKKRDPATGRITGFRILSGNPTGHHCLMVDDICDGGGTFMGLFDVILNTGAEGQSLYITHGIFSKGVDILLKRFDKIYTSDSFPKTEGTTMLSLGVIT